MSYSVPPANPQQSKPFFARIWFWLLFLSAATGTLLFGIYWGAKLHKERGIWEFRVLMNDIFTHNIQIPLNYFNSSTKPLEKIDLFIDPKDLEEIYYKREHAYDMSKEKRESSYRVKMLHNDEKKKAKIAVSGGRIDHHNSKKISMSVKLSKGGSYKGMRRFNLSHPKVRYGTYEWVGHQLARREGLIALRFDFVNLSFNGASQGVYLQEERFEQELIVNNDRREGVIFAQRGGFKLYDKKKWSKTEEGRQQIALVERFAKGVVDRTLHPRHVFDYELMAKRFAIADLMGGYHSLHPNNARYYLNPVTRKVEPISREWVANTLMPMHIMTSQYRPSSWGFQNMLFEDPNFFELYVQHLMRITQTTYINAFYQEIEPQLQTYLKAMHEEYPMHAFTKDYLLRNAKYIHSQFRAKPYFLTAYFQEVEGKGLHMLFENNYEFPLEVKKIYTRSGKAIFPKKRLIIQPKREQSFPRAYHLEVSQTDIDASSEEWIAEFGILGIKKQKSLSKTTVLPYKGAHPFEKDIITHKPNSHQFDFVRTSRSQKTIRVLKGEWDVERPVIFPKGYQVFIEAGAKLNLINQANLISYSPIEAIGSPEEPIIVHSEDKTGQGLVVIQAHKPSTFHYVHFKNLGRVTAPGWYLTSSITFYESEVDFKHCEWKNNHTADDMLNILRAPFIIDQSTFYGSYADAVDIDFGRGTFANVVFHQCGTQDGNGDCLDVSGSEVKLSQVEIYKPSDKGISAGENSTVLGDGVVIHKGNIGIASKDLSKVKLNHVRLKALNYGMVAFQKKPEFGPASIHLGRVHVESIKTLHLIEEGSDLQFEDENVEGQVASVKALLGS